ncbi:hypothetical protein GobsT_42920 [Gemmata obscuriglobus]|uniref:DUF2007 domain-containing protein n=1 Tax=Gemmata obscuriglobus TaxID=114 RepID=A0A2Z3H3M6_9BACT|nr:DUF2007 domain-containing protein [Gemmata obscuriglobus]AWM37695.1 hypothetical protein C1280_12320 [Gemmata obscuriglobus]QEG29496.1 hypothetical protein GobsT_42920 [Gemmata obscuriglobus]VTS08665.1 Uncharacterized protein OS=Planctomyces brasiliensis (strain ATCC 49424 / DSM 5305 / JCM 21570 / NBRC 103401 / IFAM 1448) GN=Plabr_0792 PE=4 SV=1: DUF2007 [Gemmata obscuriglobus UQM 2246]
MAGKLVTIATFEQGARAHLARGVLEEAGIRATVTDEAVVTMDWLLGGAVGWVKVQVLEEDADRAVAVLEETLGAETGPVDEAALAAEAEAAGEADAAERPQPEPVAIVPIDAAGAQPPSERDEYARRAFLAAFFGLIVPLLWFYALYLFLNAAFGTGSISPRYKNRLLAIGALLAIGFFTAMYLIALYRDPFP